MYNHNHNNDMRMEHDDTHEKTPEPKQTSPVHDIYSKTASELCKHEEMNYQAMNEMHINNMQGFKRLHREKSLYFKCLKIALANEIIDLYTEKLEYIPEMVNYTISVDGDLCEKMKQHMYYWKMEIEKSLEHLGMLNKRYFDIVGVDNKTICKAIKCLNKLREKACRWYRRIETSNLEHDLFVLDHIVHEHMKEKENKHGKY